VLTKRNVRPVNGVETSGRGGNECDCSSVRFLKTRVCVLTSGPYLFSRESNDNGSIPYSSSITICFLVLGNTIVCCEYLMRKSIFFG
jgi:hypothetical protein